MCRVQTRYYESQEDNACHKGEFGRMVKGGNERRTKEKGRIDNHTNTNAQPKNGIKIFMFGIAFVAQRRSKTTLLQVLGKGRKDRQHGHHSIVRNVQQSRQKNPH